MNNKNKSHKKQERPKPQPLRVEGIKPAPMTPEPDDAELAAQALLELIRSHEDGSHGDRLLRSQPQVPVPVTAHDAAYYHRLADRIRTARESARFRVTRFVAFVEQELRKPDLPLTGEKSLGLLEAELMKRIDVTERVGGELKTRWQHCVAEVMVRMMKGLPQTPPEGKGEATTDSTDSNTNTMT